MIHTSGSALRRDGQLHLADINEGSYRVDIAHWRIGSHMLPACLINLRHKWVTLTRSQSQDVVHDALLERLAARIHAVNAADLHNESKRVLSHFRVLMTDPLASELGQLLVVPADHDL
jgi:hypothetical protein